jgi:hypothetical protein
VKIADEINTLATWKAMMKFAQDQPLSDLEWYDLSALSLIDRTRLMFEPTTADGRGLRKNVRIMSDSTERSHRSCNEDAQNGAAS